MFQFDHLRTRVHLGHRNGALYVRIERQNTRAVYFWGMCFSTVIFAFFARMIWDATLMHPREVLYIGPVFLLGLVLYLLTLAYFMWSAFGVEELFLEGRTVRWQLTAVGWTHMKTIPVDEITAIEAITSWHGFDNSVEITSHGSRRRLGDKLLRQEAIELAKSLRHALRVPGSPPAGV